MESYFHGRMKELGITLADNQIEITYECYDDYVPKMADVFKENSSGDIEILYVGVNGLKTYNKGKKEAPYVRIRLHPNRCSGDMPKYLTPRGAGVEVFFPPKILQSLEKKEIINTLIITEGEFKAFKGTMHGLYCIGMQGIHNSQEKDNLGNKILNTEINRVLVDCKVKNVVFLLDNDCLNVAYEESKDLFNRPNLFYSAVKNFRESIKHLNCDTYFSHIKPEIPFKGLDDLLCNESPGNVVNDLLTLKNNSEYFSTQNISDNSLIKLKKYFHIDDVSSFYEKYEDILLQKKFKYGGYYYEYDGTKLNKIVSTKITKYQRIGDEYFEKILKPDKTGKVREILEKRLKSTIIDDYGKESIFYIKKYKAFCLVPSNIDFKEEIENCYNNYHKLTHQPSEGGIENSLKLIKHIFGHSHYQFGLDYIQLLYTEPHHLLPILLLQSEKRGTGKSTFGQWLIDIFQNNAVKLGNFDIESNFNNIYAEKLMIVVDETSLSKTVTSEAIKRMSTEKGKVIVNPKGRQQYETDWIGKFLFLTNKEETSMFIGKGETRFFVRTVPTFEVEDPDIDEKIREEIPAFLYFLKNRTIFYPRVGRMWFNANTYKTNELLNSIEANLTSTEREIRTVIEETFEAYSMQEYLEFSSKDLVIEMKGKVSYNVAETDIRRCLKGEFKMTPQSVRKYTYFSLKYAQENDNTTTYNNISQLGRPYKFNRSDFIIPL